MLSKSELRREMRTKLQALSSREKKTASDVTCDLLQAEIQQRFAAGANILCFAPQAHEVDLWPLFKNGKDEWHFFFPRIQDFEKRTLEAVEVHSESDFTPSAHFGILEPKGGISISPQNLDLILVPALAIDAAGNRLGHGQGFYDRFLAETRPDCQKWAVIFDRQKVERIPVNPYDVRMNAVITERGFVPFSSS